MLNELYNRRILELAADIPLATRLDAPDASSTKVSKLCGSKVTVDVVVESDRVVGYGADIRACALGQAASSIMARNVIGTSAAELHAVAVAVRAMLKDGAPPPALWADLAILEPVRDYKARHASTMLVFEAVEDAVEQAMAKHSQSKAGTGGSEMPSALPTLTSTGPV